MTSSRAADRPLSEEQTRLVAAAHRELEQLEVQQPQNFLVVFDMMNGQEPGHEKAIEAGRHASHAYILARMHIIERLLRRFIDDPTSDHALEAEALSQLDADFQRTMDTLAREVPAMADLKDLLTTTSLKTPSFMEPRPDAE